MRLVQSQMKTGSSRCSFTTTRSSSLIPATIPPLVCVMWGKYQQASRPVTNLSVKNILWMAGLRGRHWLVGARHRWGLILFGMNHPSHFPCAGPASAVTFRMCNVGDEHWQG